MSPPYWEDVRLKDAPELNEQAQTGPNTSLAFWYWPEAT
jgi:hypothetical protein